uniref:Uncharacterized protein n=1 Tax=Strongyloides papillosus TaxID=174720 RepID=A0A0N5BGU9_STREA
MDVLNYNDSYSCFVIFFTSLLIAFHIIVCGKKSNSKGKDTEHVNKLSTEELSSSSNTPNNRRIRSQFLPLQSKVKNVHNQLTPKKCIAKKNENKQRTADSFVYSNYYKTQNQGTKSKDEDNKVYLSKTVSDSNCMDTQDVGYQDDENNEKEKFKNETKNLLLDETQDDHANTERTISSYVNFKSNVPYIHQPYSNTRSVSVLSGISKLPTELSTRTAYQKTDNDIGKCDPKNKSEKKIRKTFEDKNLKTAYEMPLNIALPTRTPSTLSKKINNQEEKKNKTNDPIRSSYSFGSTVKETGNKREGKHTKGGFDSTETLPPPTSLQILQRHSNFELDDLTAKVRMVGETPKLEEAILFKDDDSIIAALKLKQNALVNKEKDFKTGSCENARSKDLSKGKTKVKEYPKPRKITEVYKNEEILKKMAFNKNNN